VEGRESVRGGYHRISTRCVPMKAKTPPSTDALKPLKPKAPVRVRPVPAVTRSIAILRLLGESQQDMGVKAIADALQLVPSTCLHILRVLVSEDLVRIDAGTKRYALSSGMISLARSVLAGGGFAQLVQPALDRLALNHSVTAMGVEVTANKGVTVLALSKSNQPFRLHTDVGSQFNHLASATGRLIAAYGGENWTELRKKFGAIQWDKAPSFDTWKKEVEMARARGWSIDRDHFIDGLTVVAVPLIDVDDRLSHTLVAAGLSSQLTPANAAKLAADMRREVSALADRMAARG
jgi:DNA-binding IclR family transcriptional regulator